MFTNEWLTSFRKRLLSANCFETSRPSLRRLGCRNRVRRLSVEALEDRTCLSGLFEPALGSPFPVGEGPSAVVAGDFNGDGALDLAAANGSSDDVSVLLGDGTGGLAAATGSPFSVGDIPLSVAVGDFNGDGNPDLATANSGSADVSVLLGDGTGGFVPADGSPFSAGSGAKSVAVGDFDGDGDLDLVVANGRSDDVSVLLGNGAGGFAPAANSPFAVGAAPLSVAVGDFNTDGDLDLAAANSHGQSVSVLLGDGAGGLSSAAGSPFSVGDVPASVAVGDFNGDGRLDLATADARSRSVSVLLGDGTGGFAPAAGSPFLVGEGPQSVAAADFDGDGELDLVTANFDSNDVSLLLNTTDTLPPTLTGLMDVILEAAGGLPGVHYAFEVSASDDSGQVTLSCSPQSGAFFPLGVTTVTCTAVDPSGNAASGSFTVTVLDTTPPTLIAPADVTINAWEDAGPANTGTPTAADNAGDPVVTFADSVFVGPTATEITRVWSASDASGNVATAVQRITVVTDPGLLIPDLTAEVEELELPDGPYRALAAKLDAALESLQAGDVEEAGNILDAFIHHVNAQRGKQLTDVEADALIEAATTVIALLPEV